MSNSKPDKDAKGKGTTTQYLKLDQSQDIVTGNTHVSS